jgi:hypothetical protein
MKVKYHGPFRRLTTMVKACDPPGKWSLNIKNTLYTFHAESGEVLNWRPRTGTVQFQGGSPEEFRVLFCSLMSADGPRNEVPYVEVRS